MAEEGREKLDLLNAVILAEIWNKKGTAHPHEVEQAGKRMCAYGSLADQKPRTARSRLSALARKGYVEEHEIPDGRGHRGSPRFNYSITEVGVNELKGYLSRRLIKADYAATIGLFMDVVFLLFDVDRDFVVELMSARYWMLSREEAKSPFLDEGDFTTDFYLSALRGFAAVEKAKIAELLATEKD